jgi:hypothetical protein
MAAAAAPAVPDHLRNSRRVIAIIPPFKNVCPDIRQLFNTSTIGGISAV